MKIKDKVLGINQVKKGEVYLYWTKRHEAVGTEIKKNQRPGVIVSVDDLNLLDSRFIIIPLTSQKSNRIYSYEVPVKFDNKPGKALLDQIKTVSKIRLIKKLGEITEQEAQEINDKLLSVFGLWEHLLKKVSSS